MKYLLLLALLALLFFMLGAKRGRPREPEAGAAPPPPPKPQAMLRCAECGLHLPADDALPGKGGVFCSAAHRASFEARQGQA
ncbi:PP0621 family protein [Roseateles sp.]|uniref:PP0621 family protein n=1 Tax=Roseateles sp. TaxID=1971397 RepID=UPI002DFE544C|nr:PP0621 family protein [Roseateles sp.]